MVFGKYFRLYHKTDANNTYSLLYENKNDKNETLLFESGAIGCLSQQEAEKLKPLYTFLTDVYGCLGVLNFSVDDKQSFLFLVCVSGAISVGKINNSEIFCVNDTQFIPLIKHDPQETAAYNVAQKITDVSRTLNSCTFYFSWTNPGQQKFDLTLCAQKAERSSTTDNRFFWNRMLHLPFKSFDINTDKWLFKIMAGGVNINTVYVGAIQAKACLISRLSCERAGTRFNVRGTNDFGHVANFVETEQVIFLGDRVSSYILIRGSIPLFWDQTGVQVGSHKVKMSRGAELSQAAYDRHMALILYLYGEQVLINLVGHKEGEHLIGKNFAENHKNSRFADQIPYIAFDYHHECPRGKEDRLAYLKRKMDHQIEDFGFYYSVGEQKAYQKGTFRVNCIDCLDRTNRVQTFIAHDILKKQLRVLELDTKPTLAARFIEVFTNMWQINGDQISRIYAGTGALEGKSKFRDGTLSVARTIQNNFLDQGKQEAIDILLTGKASQNLVFHKARSMLPLHYVHLPFPILKGIINRFYDYAEPTQIKVSVGTWNVNGGKHFDSILYKQSNPLSDWLFDAHSSSKAPNLLDLSLDDSLREVDPDSADLVAVGFEEIVDLNAQNIVNASTANQGEWMNEIKKNLSKRGHYVIVTSVQLVGVCLFLFTKPKFARYIRDVAIDQVKTGMKGATGNKGGVGIRLQLFSSSLCFVCSHFAAGQKQVNDRNNDFYEIERRMFSTINRTIRSHDYVFWCGDFNYRIDLPIDEVKQLVREENWDALLEADQLLVQKRDDKCFRKYREGEIRFAPTYKYDINSDDYDTSEKSRIPAWTDRVLFRKFNPTRRDENREDLNYGEIVYYCRAELKTSDHRPVIGEFKVDVLKVDHDKLYKTFRQVIEEVGPLDSTIIIRDDGFDGLEKAVHNPEYVQEIMSILEQRVGKIVLARLGHDHLVVILDSGKSALEVAADKILHVRDRQFRIELKTPNWTHLIEEEVNLGINNTVPLIENKTLFNIDEIEDYEVGILSRSTSPEEVQEENLTALKSCIVSASLPSRPPPPSSGAAQNKPMRPAPPPPRSSAAPARPSPPTSTVSIKSLLDTSIPATSSPLEETLNSSFASVDTTFDMSAPHLPPPSPPTRASVGDSDDDEVSSDEEGSAPPSFAPPPSLAPLNIPPSPPVVAPNSCPPPAPARPPPGMPLSAPPTVPARRPPPSIPPRNI